MGIKDSADNKIMGDKFEAYVGTLYQSLGYRVSYNVQLSGQQVDLLAEKMIAGAGLSKLSIECKYQSNGKIGNQKVFDFISSSETLIRNDGITKSVMVTNTGFTDTGWAAAQKNQLIELMTQRSLEDQLFDLANTYRSFVDTYESTEIFNEYVELNGIYNDGREVKEKVNNIEEFLILLLEKPHDRLITLFGDFGSGKTTMLNRIKYVFAKAYIEGRSTLKPFLVNLKEFYKYDTIDKLLTHSAVREFEREVSVQLIYRQIENDQLILLLDGFDEMAQHVDTDIRIRNFLQLAPLLRQRSVITCRPSYFISKHEYINYRDQLVERSALKGSIDGENYKKKNTQQKELMSQLSTYLTQEFITPQNLKKVIDLLDFEVIEIEMLSSDSIDEYLKNNDIAFKRSLGFGWSYVKNYLLQIYDITDLMTRPMLLKMIVKTLLSGKLGLQGKQANIGPAGLYELYTSLYLDIDFQKGSSRQLFTPDQRRSLAIGISLLMFKQHSLEVSYDRLLIFIAEHSELNSILGDVKHLTFEQIVADIQICTFLVASESAKFRFAHKSFMEFFFARYLNHHLLSNNIPEEFFEMLPKEVLYFLGSFSTVDSNLAIRLVKWLEDNVDDPQKIKLVRNLASAILYGGAMISELNWKNLEISFIEFKRRSLKRVRFEKVNILRVDFLNANFYNNEWQSILLQQVNFTNCEIYHTEWSAIADSVNILGGKIGNSTLSCSGKELLLADVQVSDSTLSFSGTAIVKNCNFYSSTISCDTLFPGNVLFQKCDFDLGQVIFPITGKLPNYQFLECKFSGHIIVLTDNGLPSRIFERCTFKNCTVGNLRLDLHAVKTNKFIDCSGYVLIDVHAATEEQLKDFKKFSGGMSFFKRDQLYYLPEQTWNACKCDFKKFKKKIADK